MNNSPEIIARQLIQARGGGRVERCHGIAHHGSYSNAAHSWGVAMLMWYLWPEDFPRLAIFCLSHDVPEAWVGDIPAPTMRYVPGLKEKLADIEDDLNKQCGLPGEHELSEDDHAKMKACDRLDFYLWCRDQESMGNKFAAEALKEIERYFKEVPLPKRAQLLYLELSAMDDTCPVQAGIMRSTS